MIFNKLHVVTFVGTRPEIIRLSRVISQLESSKAINHTIIHTGQNYDYNLNEVFFNELEIPKPNYFLDGLKQEKIYLDLVLGSPLFLNY